MSGTLTRVLAAAAGLAVLVPVLVWGGWTGMAVLVALMAGVGIWEYASMAFPAHRLQMLPQLATGTLPVVLSLQGGFAEAGGAICVLVFVALAARGVFQSDVPLERGADHVGRLILGCCWMGLLATLLLIRATDPGMVGVWWVVLTLSISWMGDTGAYFAGRALGKTPLYKRISPKKTREGFFGGLVFSVLGVVVISQTVLTAIPLEGAVALGVVGGCAGVLGDLFESLLKRSFGVKDSGSIMPGHGGILDRIDSVLFVGPVVYGYMVFFPAA